MERERAVAFGTLECAIYRSGGRERSRYRFQCDRCAANRDGTLYLASVLGESQAVKGFRAAINSDDNISLRLVDCRPVDPSGHTVYNVRPDPGRYHVYTHRLDYGWYHAIAVTRDERFLPCVSQEGVWQALAGQRCTTPLLRSWMPWLVDRLRAADWLRRVCCHGCESGWLSVSTEELDQVVAGGLRSREIVIESEPGIRRLAS